MIEVTLAETDGIDWALKVFKRKVQKSGILKELKQKRHYLKPSVARALKTQASRRRRRTAEAKRQSRGR
ncbi:MAG: 30S ribosomal protein S21 [Gemmatimonadetes bacterium]|nr:30S ribosomal protein S21 [Gemmatimonadota bacterium]